MAAVLLSPLAGCAARRSSSAAASSRSRRRRALRQGNQVCSLCKPVHARCGPIVALLIEQGNFLERS